MEKKQEEKHNSNNILMTILKTPLLFCKWILYGVLTIFIFIYKFVYYIGLGFITPFVAVIKLIEKDSERRLEKNKEKLLRIAQEKLLKEQEKEDKLREQEKRKQRIEERKRNKQKKDKDSYKNEKVTIEKKTLTDRVNDFLLKLSKIPGNIKKKYNNSTFVKNQRNKQDIERQALLINFEGEDAEKSDVKLLYEYVAKNDSGKVIKGYFEAFSKVEVHSFLLSEGYEVYSIKTSKMIRFLHGNSHNTKTKIKIKDLIFFLTQLSTYIKAGIPLVDSLKILARQYKNKTYQLIFRSMIYDLTMGDNFSEAMTKQGSAFPRLLINMIKSSEMTGELPEALDDMSEYYTEANKTKKQMVTAMMYPMIVLVISVIVIIFILVYVIPKFVAIYETMDASAIPGFTRFIMKVSEFLQHKGIFLLIGVAIFVIIMRALYKNIKMIRAMFQWIVMHLPIFGNVIIYNEVTMFTKTFASLLSHNVFITDSMEILNKITNNEIYKMLILDTITNLAHGDKISDAFKDHWAFPVPAYEMLVTGERTGELPEMMKKVSEYYQELHKDSVTRIKTFMEPALIIFLTGIVGVIVLAVVIPMFGMYSAIQE